MRIIESSERNDLLTFLKQELRITDSPVVNETDDDIQAVIDIKDSDTFGVILSRLDKNPDIKELIDNDEFSAMKASKMYKTVKKPTYIINLLGDLTADTYQLVITYNKE